MRDDDEIERLRQELNHLEGPARIPILVDLAEKLCHRWLAQPQADVDITEAVTHLREARSQLRRSDPVRAQVSGLLGSVLVVRSALGGGRDRQDDPDRHEAIECLTEATEHPDLPRATLEMALLYLAMALLIRALPPGSVAGLSIDGLLRAGPAALPNVLDYLKHANRPERLADLERAEAHLNRLRSMAPVNDQIHALGSNLYNLIQIMRILLGDHGVLDLVTLLSRLGALWPEHPSDAGPFGTGPLGAGPLGARAGGLPGVLSAGFPGGPGFPGLAGSNGLRDNAPPIVLPAIASGAGTEMPVDPGPTTGSRPVARDVPAPRTEQVLVDIDADDYLAVTAFAQARNVQVERTGDRGGDDGTGPLALLLRGPAASVRATLDLIERHKGGHIIDLRADAATGVSRRRDLPHGQVLLVAPDGEVTVEVHDPDRTLRAVMDAITRMRGELVGRDSDGVRDAVDRTVGDRATVVRRPAPPSP